MPHFVIFDPNYPEKSVRVQAKDSGEAVQTLINLAHMPFEIGTVGPVNADGKATCVLRHRLPKMMPPMERELVVAEVA